MPQIRVLVLAYMLLVRCYDWMRTYPRACGRWCYLTSWSFDLLTLHVACCVLLGHRDRNASWTADRWTSRARGILFSVSSTTALVVSLGYNLIFIWLEPHQDTLIYWVHDLSVHTLNSVIAAYEISDCGITMHPGDVRYLLAFLLTYFVFNLTWGEQIYAVMSLATPAKTCLSLGIMCLTLAVSTRIHAAVVRWRR